MAGKDKKYSVTEAEGRLPALISEVEGGSTIHISHRGRPTAVLISETEYDRLRLGNRRQTLGDAVRTWRAHNEARLEPDEFCSEQLRDSSAGRDIDVN